MKIIQFIVLAIFVTFSPHVFAQDDDPKPVEVYVNKLAMKKTFIEIIKAEDELRFDKTLEDILERGNVFERERAAIAAGRIGDEAAIPFLVKILENDRSAKARANAAFGLGEIESIKASDAILKVMGNKGFPGEIRSRALEAAGKIAAANAKEEKSKDLAKSILETLEYEENRGSEQSKEVILLGITAALRAKPENGELVLAKFLKSLDGRIRSDAGNALARLRAKNANETFRSMLVTDIDPNARANAARALGAAENEGSLDLLVASALTDRDLRVRVSAIRSVGASKDKKSGERLIVRGEKLLADAKASKAANPFEKNELLEIVSALGRIFSNTKNEKAVKLLDAFRKIDKYESPETEVAMARILTNEYFASKPEEVESNPLNSWKIYSAAYQGLGEIANLEGNPDTKIVAKIELLGIITKWVATKSKKNFPKNTNLAIPDLLRAYAAFKSETISNIYTPMLASENDLFIRGTLADILADQPAKKETTDALKAAFESSLKTDHAYNDAQFSILSALVKLDKKESVESLRLALKAPDHLVRRHAAKLIKQNDLVKDFANIDQMIGTVKTYDVKSGTKLGQILNNPVDYARAVSRTNGTVKAVVTTGKGKFTIDLFPEDAPLTVDNFIKLAKSKYFNGVEFHRVVSNFVIKDGDTRGDGNGGPGWSIRCEIKTLPYERGSVGMALSGKDTGGSQWFVTHAPQPHLDGGYTVFGKVNETEMKTVDQLTRGDKILNMVIVEGMRK